MTQYKRGLLSLSLAGGLIVGGLPAEASEVVKFARLVVSGKRSAMDAPRITPPEQRPSPSSPQAQGGSGGGSDMTGTAPAPARGVS